MTPTPDASISPRPPPTPQLGGDTTDLRVLGVDLKLVGVQDLGDRERCLFDAFAVDECERAELVERVVADATAGLEGVQLITDQGTPYVAEAAQQAYDNIGVEHAPQREGTPTDKATVERAFATVKNALAPILAALDRLAAAVPQLQQPRLAQSVATLLVATFLRVYAAGRRHLGHPLDGQDPDVLRTIVEEQRAKARAEDRSVRLFLESVHAEYAMPGSAEAFVRTFRRYPLDDLKDAERRFPHLRLPLQGARLRPLLRRRRTRRARTRQRQALGRMGSNAAPLARLVVPASNAAQRAADLDAHPERRLHEGLDVLTDTWQPDEGAFLFGGQLARAWLRRTVEVFASRESAGFVDCIEAHLRSWLAARPTLPVALCVAVRGVLRDVITEVQRAPHSAIPGRSRR